VSGILAGGTDGFARYVGPVVGAVRLVRRPRSRGRTVAADFATVEDYIASFPADVRATLRQVRGAILAAVPGAGERISYQIPTVTLAGRSVVHYAAWTGHLSVYPIPTADDAFRQELAPYVAAKGTLRFPYGARCRTS
jgi:uncharacterized protein YdhG (YjbR/CyaY superfamily)